jgi:hypothetical protein
MSLPKRVRWFLALEHGNRRWCKGFSYMSKRFSRCKDYLAWATPFVERMAIFDSKKEAEDFLWHRWEKHKDLSKKIKPVRRMF